MSLNYGRMQRADEVTSMFLNGEILPNHKYYYAGTPQNPHTLLTLKETYRFTSPRWRAFELDRDKLSGWSVTLRNFYASAPRGSWIVDAEGNRIGAWYSSAPTSPIKIVAEDEVKIKAPSRPRLRGETHREIPKRLACETWGRWSNC